MRNSVSAPTTFVDLKESKQPTVMFAFPEYCFYALMSFLKSAVLGGSVDSKPIFEDVTPFAQLSVLLPLPKDVYTPFSSFGLYDVCQFHLKAKYSVYYRCIKVGGAYETCVEWLLNLCGRGDVLHIPA